MQKRNCATHSRNTNVPAEKSNGFEGPTAMLLLAAVPITPGRLRRTKQPLVLTLQAHHHRRLASLNDDSREAVKLAASAAPPLRWRRWQSTLLHCRAALAMRLCGK